MPDIFDRAAAFRGQLLRNERRAASAMVRAYGETWENIQAQLEHLTRELEAARSRGEALNLAWLSRQQRLETLQRQAEAELRRFARYAEEAIREEQRRAVDAAEAHTADLLATAAGEPPAGVTMSFNRLPSEATTDLVGFLSDGSPLRELLDELGADASESIRNALVEGLATGQNPRRIASRIRGDLGGNLTRALTISRTETLRAYREASRRTYAANADVLEGWTWVAALGPRSCPACIAMHGTVHGPEERLDGHPNCRCVMAPRTKSWDEILGDATVPDTRPQIERGEDWFGRQPTTLQREVLGDAAFSAYRRQEVALSDFIGRKHSPRWGSMRYTRSLRDALSEGRRRNPNRSGGGPTPPSAAPAGRPEARTPRPPARRSYPQLDPALQSLRGDTLRIWGDEAVREQALRDILDAYRAGDAGRLEVAVKRVDTAVEKGVRALGYPRGPVRSVKVQPLDANGAKDWNCDVLIGIRWLEQSLTTRRPDSVFRTWVHESMHARQPFASGFSAEYRPYTGYEEGMVEGLARLLTRDRAGMNPITRSYTYYVRSYEIIAEELQVPVDAVYRRMWQHPTGRVRSEFTAEIDALRQSAGAQPLTDTQRSNLQDVADDLFGSTNLRAGVNEATIRRRWQSALSGP